jgi:hypothetical protein
MAGCSAEDRAGLLETGEVRTNGPPLRDPSRQSYWSRPRATRRYLDLVRPPSLSPFAPVAAEVGYRDRPGSSGATAGSARPEPDDLGEWIVDQTSGEVIGEKMGAILVFLMAPLEMVERKKT